MTPHGARWRSWIGTALLLVAGGALFLRPAPGGAGDPRQGPGRAEPSGSSTRAFVRRVVDGDTIEARLPGGGVEDVRYIGIDTPETVKPGAPVGCFGHRASDFNHTLVEHRPVRLVFDVERRDVYGRLLAYVYLGRTFVNAEIIRRGFARSLTIPPNDSHAQLFRRLERRAGRRGRGLWSTCSP